MTDPDDRPRPPADPGGSHQQAASVTPVAPVTDTAAYVAALGGGASLAPRPQPSRLTRVLVGLLIFGLGLWAGIGAQKLATALAGGSEEAPTANETPGADPSAPGSERPFGAFGGVEGEITVLEPGALYLRTSDGATVKVAVGGDVVVLQGQTATVADLRPGDQVAVRGRAGPDGVVIAEALGPALP
ncbi:MAG: hypothetical protein ACT4OS_00210 [Acidimicrobiales bacterium]